MTPSASNSSSEDHAGRNLAILETVVQRLLEQSQPDDLRLVKRPSELAGVTRLVLADESEQIVGVDLYESDGDRCRVWVKRGPTDELELIDDFSFGLENGIEQVIVERIGEAWSHPPMIATDIVDPIQNVSSDGIERAGVSTIDAFYLLVLQQLSRPTDFARRIAHDSDFSPIEVDHLVGSLGTFDQEWAQSARAELETITRFLLTTSLQASPLAESEAHAYIRQLSNDDRLSNLMKNGILRSELPSSKAIQTLVHRVSLGNTRAGLQSLQDVYSWLVRHEDGVVNLVLPALDSVSWNLRTAEDASYSALQLALADLLAGPAIVTDRPTQSVVAFTAASFYSDVELLTAEERISRGEAAVTSLLEDAAALVPRFTRNLEDHLGPRERRHLRADLRGFVDVDMPIGGRSYYQSDLLDEMVREAFLRSAPLLERKVARLSASVDDRLRLSINEILLRECLRVIRDGLRRQLLDELALDQI